MNEEELIMAAAASVVKNLEDAGKKDSGAIVIAYYERALHIGVCRFDMDELGDAIQAAADEIKRNRPDASALFTDEPRH